jgi:peroxiredoxin
MAMMVAVGLALGRRPALRVNSVQIRIAIGLGVVAVMVFKLDLFSSLVILATAALLGTGISLLLRSGPQRSSAKLRSGGLFPAREVEAISGERIRVPDDARVIHLQFRRFAGCPVCNLHLRSIVRRHAEINLAGIREVVVFHSGREELLEHAADLPFAVVADPDKRLYAEYGVNGSARALLDPRVWMPIIVGVPRSAVSILRRQGRPPKLSPTGGRLGLPADFLIGTDGRILAAKYGVHAYDQWSVDELLSLALCHPGVEISTVPRQVHSPT